MPADVGKLAANRIRKGVVFTSVTFISEGKTCRGSRGSPLGRGDFQEIPNFVKMDSSVVTKMPTALPSLCR